jgi:hypothetical protein
MQKMMVESLAELVSHGRRTRGQSHQRTRDIGPKSYIFSLKADTQPALYTIAYSMFWRSGAFALELDRR